MARTLDGVKHEEHQALEVGERVRDSPKAKCHLRAAAVGWRVPQPSFPAMHARYVSWAVPLRTLDVNQSDPVQFSVLNYRGSVTLF